MKKLLSAALIALLMIAVTPFSALSAVSKAANVRITWNANGGKIGTKKSVATSVRKGAKIGKLPKTPVFAGYTFKGWYTKKAGGAKVTASTKPNKSATYYAQWTAKKYKLTFNPNGGKVSPSSKKIAFGKAYGTLPTPTRSGYAFSGWYTKKTGGAEVTKNTKMAAKNVTIYARWEKGGETPAPTAKPTPVPTAKPTPTPQPKSKIAQLVAGKNGHYFLLLTKGDLYGWGNNGNGELGDNTTEFRKEPVKIGSGFTQIAAGYRHTLALKGTDLYAWGDNGYGQLGDGTYTGQRVPKLIDRGFVKIAAGDYFSLGIKANGDLYAWGLNNYGQVGNGTTVWDLNRPTKIGAGFSQISAGGSHALALKGTALYAWGLNHLGQLGDGTGKDQLAPVIIGTGFSQISAGDNHSLALKGNALYMWGAGTYGAYGVYKNSRFPVEIGTGYTQISAGKYHSLALRGTDLYSWGSNDGYRLGNDSIGEGVYTFIPEKIGSGFSHIATGNWCSHAVKDDDLYIWGAVSTFSIITGDGVGNITFHIKTPFMWVDFTIQP